MEQLKCGGLESGDIMLRFSDGSKTSGVIDMWILP